MVLLLKTAIERCLIFPPCLQCITSASALPARQWQYTGTRNCTPFFTHKLITALPDFIHFNQSLVDSFQYLEWQRQLVGLLVMLYDFLNDVGLLTGSDAGCS